MNPLMLGIVAVVGVTIIMNLNKKDPDDGDVMINGPERSYPWPAFIVSGQSGVVPYAGFRGGGVSGTVSEEYLPPLGGLGGSY